MDNWRQDIGHFTLDIW